MTHDLGARNDPKLLKLQMEMGGQGLAIFWCLAEMLWENDGRMPLDPPTIAFSLRWATADEVSKVISDYGLFESQDGQFWSRSALERIAQKKDKIQARSDAGRTAGLASARKRATIVQPSFNDCKTDDEPINKDIKKEREKEKNNNNKRPTAEDFFETFFFGNVKDPRGEAERFVAYYEERGWTYQDGTPVEDVEKVAKDWKPAKQGKRWDEESLRWYKAIWIAARNRDGNGGADVFLHQLTNVRRKGQHLALVFRTADAAREVSNFISDNDLAGDWLLDYRVEN